MELPSPSIKQWSTLGIEFIRFAQGSTWLPGYRFGEDWFEHALIDFTYWFIYKGKGELTDVETGVSYPMHAGVCILMKPGGRYTASQVGNDGLGNLYFHMNLLKADRSFLPVADWPDAPLYTEVVDIDYFHMTSRRLLELLRRSREGDARVRPVARCAAEQLLKGMVLDLCHLHEMPVFGNTELHHQRAVEKALRALDENPQRFFSVEAWASMVGYSTSHFRTLCLKCTGKSPMEHLIEARIRQAKDYLRSSSLTVGMIAHHLGYESAHYFSRQFRQQTGMSASEYRQKVLSRKSS